MDALNLNLTELSEDYEDSGENSLLNLSAEFEDELDCYRSTTLELVSPQAQLFLVILYSCTSFLSLIGNVTVIIVQVVGRESAKSVRKHLISLAVADIISGVLCVPFTYTNYVLRQWIFPGWLCPTAQYAQLLSVFITSNTLTIIGIERYMATLHPFSCIHRWLRSHTPLLLGLTWVLGAAYAYIPFSHTATTKFMYNNRTYHSCSYDNDLSLTKRRLFMHFNFILTFLIPSITLTISYLAILKKLRNQKNKCFYFNDFHCCSNTNSSDCNSGGRNRTQILRRRSKRITNRIKTIKIMLVLIVLYDTCWFPIKLYQFLIDYDLITFCTETQFNALIYTYVTFHWLAMSNSVWNPVVYSFMSANFRSDFKRILPTFPKVCFAKKPAITNENDDSSERL